MCALRPRVSVYGLVIRIQVSARESCAPPPPRRRRPCTRSREIYTVVRAKIHESRYQDHARKIYAIHTAKKHDLRQKHYGKNTTLYGKNTAKASKYKAKTRQKQQAKCTTRRKDLGGQKCQTLVGKNARWPVAGKNDSSRGASYTEAPLHSLVDAEVGRKMDLAQQEWTLWWAKMDRGGQER